MTSPKKFLICPECSARFEQTHHRALFCSPAHSKAYNNRQLTEGQRVVAMAKAWRAMRNTRDPKLKEAGRSAFAQLCAELDILNQNDAAAGRQPALKLYERRKRAGLLDFQGPAWVRPTGGR